ncbi:MAG: hypothetical protein ABI905_06465 [Betaproteobacteria bacterium]
MNRFLSAVILCLSSFALEAAPLDLLGIKPGSSHRVSVGGGEINVRVVETGREGWVLFSVISDDSRWQRGTRLWLNLDRLDNISAPTSSSISLPLQRPVPAESNDKEKDISTLPCFSQADARDVQAAAKGESFDKNQFLTECILSQRKKP